MPVRTELPNALEHFEIDALFGQTSEERAAVYDAQPLASTICRPLAPSHGVACPGLICSRLQRRRAERSISAGSR
jgi:hypothetical protein